MTRWLHHPSPARRPFALAVVALVTLLVAAGSGCSSSSQDRPDAVAPPPPPMAERPLAAPTTLSPVVPEPMPGAVTGPISIPADPYAPEPLAQLGTIEIPKLGLKDALYQGVTLRNIDRGPSHWPGSALPGQPGNAVVAGHRSARSQPFRDLDALVAGDTVTFIVGGVRSTYLVTGNRVVEPEATWIADQTETPTATLYACHPPGSATQRYVVHLALLA